MIGYPYVTEALDHAEQATAELAHVRGAGVPVVLAPVQRDALHAGVQTLADQLQQRGDA